MLCDMSHVVQLLFQVQILHLLDPKAVSSKEDALTSVNSFPLTFRPQLLRISKHIRFFKYSTTKIQRHFEEFPFVHLTITSKQVPVQQFKHPRYALHIIRPDTLSVILDEPSAILSLTKVFLPKK